MNFVIQINFHWEKLASSDWNCLLMRVLNNSNRSFSMPFIIVQPSMQIMTESQFLSKKTIKLVLTSTLQTKIASFLREEETEMVESLEMNLMIMENLKTKKEWRKKNAIHIFGFQL